MGALTAAVARTARSGLAIAGLGLGIAALVAFLPLGGASSESSVSRNPFANNSSGSVTAVRNIFSDVALAATVQPSATSGVAPIEVAAAALATPEQPSNAASPATAATEPPVGQTTVQSALQAVTPSTTVIPASAVPTQTAVAVATATLAPTQPPAATEVAAAEAYVSSNPSLQDALAASQWPAELWPTVERIVMCESSGNTAAYNPAGYVGLMQVSPSLHGAVPADAVGQLNQGYDVYLKQGWGAWGCY